MNSDSPVFESPEFSAPADEEGGEVDEDPDREHLVSSGRAGAVLEHVTRSIVEDPDAVQITLEKGRAGLLFSVRVAPSDMGRVIGKRGRVAQALRTVVRAAAAREGSDASVDIVD